MWLPIDYDEPLFRPPAEANSLIIQITKGCSHNKCSFCEMYTSKSFAVKSLEEVKSQIDIAYTYLSVDVRKIFLADANALVAGYDLIKNAILYLKEKFPKIRRISAYALPSDILRLGEEKLLKLKSLGLDLLYIGIESGSDRVLKMINKSKSKDSTIKGIAMAHSCDIKTSVMILNGIGGKKYSEEHALESADIINKLQPHYLSTLVLSFPFGIEHFKKRIKEDFEMLNQKELLLELQTFLSNLHLDSTIFRSDHVSNSLILKGVFKKDKESLLKQITLALHILSQ